MANEKYRVNRKKEIIDSKNQVITSEMIDVVKDFFSICIKGHNRLVISIDDMTITVEKETTR